MELQHRFTVPASVDETWQAFNDLERVAPCFPGASLTSVEGDTFKGTVDSEFIGKDVDQTGQQNTIAAALQADPSIDGFMGTGPVIAISGLNAVTDAGATLKGIAGFDITPEIIDAISAGTIAFTIDQQQYLQGYLPILLLYLYVTNLNVAGGGLPILTGPGFVDKSNADQVAALVQAGTR